MSVNQQSVGHHRLCSQKPSGQSENSYNMLASNLRRELHYTTYPNLRRAGTTVHSTTLHGHYYSNLEIILQAAKV